MATKLSSLTASPHYTTDSELDVQAKGSDNCSGMAQRPNFPELRKANHLVALTGNGSGMDQRSNLPKLHKADYPRAITGYDKNLGGEVFSYHDEKTQHAAANWLPIILAMSWLAYSQNLPPLKNLENRKRIPRGAQIEIANLLNNLLNDWKLSKNEMIVLLGLDDDHSGREYVESLLAGRCSFSGRDTRNRMARLIQIREALFAIFKNHEMENEWLRASQEMLNDQVPMDLLLEGSMENLWLVQEFVESAAGW